MSGGRKSVLVVSDSASVQKNIKDSLKDSGYDICPVVTEAACLETIAGHAPALVLLSLFEKTVDARQLLAGIRATDSELPVVLMADAGTAGDLVGLLRSGASDYFIYPPADASLVQYILARNIERRNDVRKQRRGERDMKRLNKALVESLKALEQDQQAGLRVQQDMMPESPFSWGAVELAHLILPSLILSGDFIDYFELPDGRLLFYIADVSGHGTSGAIVTVLLKSLSTRLCNEFDELGLDDAGQILGWFNRELVACGLPQHVTMFLGVMDSTAAHLEYANAAHFPATILSSAGSAHYLEVGGLPLGIYETADYMCRQLTLPANFRLVMFSDGVFEIMAEKSLKAKEKKLLSLVECGASSITALADRLGLGEVKEVPDDIAVFTVARAG